MGPGQRAEDDGSGRTAQGGLLRAVKRDQAEEGKEKSRRGGGIRLEEGSVD